MHLQISECFCFGTRQKGFVFSNFPKQKCWKVTDVNENIFETLLSHQKLAICLFELYRLEDQPGGCQYFF